MMMSAHLRLGGWSTEMKQAHVNAIMEKLGLHLVADVLVGDDKMVGISGGERKRLAIGMAMIGLKFPSILFLGELACNLPAALPSAGPHYDYLIRR
jgi:ABC-type multidrug transport system ATPase subunit